MLNLERWGEDEHGPCAKDDTQYSEKGTIFFFYYFFGKEVKNVAASVVTSEQRSVQHPADVVDPPPCSRAQMLQGAEHQ